jgi:glycosyltransferase involved in cell wall biosynthesis
LPPKISIITPAFNSAGTIADTLRSVREQDYPDIEHIVVDGGSTDGTVTILQQTDARITYLSEPDEGIYDAMNKGLRMAAGEIIGILNSDDVYAHPAIIGHVVREMESRQCDALYGDLVYVDARDTRRIVRTWIAGEFRLEKFLYGWMPPHPTFFVRRRIYGRYGSFDTSLRSSADYELMLRLLYRHRVTVTYLPECIVRMRAGGRSNSSLRQRLRANAEDRHAWKKNNLQPKFYTTWLKPIRKIPQFI